MHDDETFFFLSWIEFLTKFSASWIRLEHKKLKTKEGQGYVVPRILTTYVIYVHRIRFWWHQFYCKVQSSTESFTTPYGNRICNNKSDKLEGSWRKSNYAINGRTNPVLLKGIKLNEFAARVPFNITVRSKFFTARNKPDPKRYLSSVSLVLDCLSRNLRKYGSWRNETGQI